jgi:RND family efflux transporter MFP subunit
MKYYSIVTACILLLASCSNNNDKKEIVQKTNTTNNYKLATVRKGGVATSIKLPGQLAAYLEVNIFPKVNGYVKNVNVDIGSKVSKGNLLLTLDAPELQQNVLQAKEKFVKANADYSIDKEHYQRLQEAAKTAGAISPLDISTLKAKVDADMAVCNAEKANWQMQQTMQGYLNVTAPFNGVITERNVHPGDLVSAVVKDKPMLELKQTDILRLQVDIPETIAAALKDKDAVTFFLSAFPGKKMTGTITRKSDNVNAQYRNERIEIDVNNKEGSLNPGMYADVYFDAKGDSNAFFVPKSAVVTSTERKYILLYNNGKIKKIDVSTGNETLDSIQVYGLLKEGDQIIANGNDEIEEVQ